MTDTETVYRLAIGVITRQRSKIFGELLDGLAELDWPKNVEPVFILVENDRQLNISDQIEKFRKKVPGAEIHTGVETTLGIPFARNHVLDIGLSKGCDFLAFLDDDELANKDWINLMFLKIEQDMLDLVGGPLELISPQQKLSYFQNLCWEFLLKKNSRRRDAADRLVTQDNEGSVRIFTNNWLVRLDFIRNTGLRFDENLGLSGGSDTRFYVESKKLGAKTGWQRDAIVRDRIPLSRLTLSYQFKRARDQNLALYFIDGRDKKTLPRLRTTLSLLRSLVRATVKFILSIFKNGRGAVDSVTLVGARLGRVYAAFGVRSSHYKKVTDAD